MDNNNLENYIQNAKENHKTDIRVKILATGFIIQIIIEILSGTMTNGGMINAIMFALATVIISIKMRKDAEENPPY